MKTKTGIRQEPNGWSAWFKIDNQTFYLQERDTQEEALFFEEQLNAAFQKLNKTEDGMCVVCGRIPVDVNDGFDTCSSCVKTI